MRSKTSFHHSRERFFSSNEFNYGVSLRRRLLLSNPPMEETNMHIVLISIDVVDDDDDDDDNDVLSMMPQHYVSSCTQNMDFSKVQ